MSEILLTQGQVALVDEEDFDRVSQWKWHAWWNPNTQTFYARRTIKKWEKIPMASLIMRSLPGQEVDHRNHDTLDNRKTNLRICTRSQNNMNHRRPSNNTSGIKGVSWYKRSRCYRAYIMLGRKQIHLGLFSLLEEAAQARRQAEKIHFGEFTYQGEL